MFMKKMLHIAIDAKLYLHLSQSTYHGSTVVSQLECWYFTSSNNGGA